MISNVDLQRLSFPVNIYSSLETHFQGWLFPLSCPLEDQVMILCALYYFPHSTLASPEDRCDLFEQQGCTRCLFTQPDCCEIEELGCASPCS